MFDNPFQSDSSFGGGYQPSLRLDAKRGELYVVDPSGPGEDSRRTTVPIGTLVIVDFGCTLIGGVIFKPKFVERLAPLGAAIPTFPDNEPWQMATRLQVIVDGYGGLRTWLLTGKLVTRSIAQLRTLCNYRSEAVQGLLPIFRLTGFSPVQTEFGTFYTPLLELVDFTDRDEGVFGPRLVPPPPPILATQAVLPALPQPIESALMATPEPPAAPEHLPTPTQDIASPETPPATGKPTAQPVSSNEPAAQPSSSPATDPFAGYRPGATGKRAGGRKPY